LNSKKPRINEWQINKNMERLSNRILDSKKDADKNNAKNSEDFMKIIAKMDNVIKVTDGVYYQVIKKGDGAKPNANSTVTISYDGTTPVNAYQDNKDVLNDIKDAKLVGKSFDSNDNISFPLQKLIPCWKDAIPAISKGTTFILYCSADKAYGENAPPSIGPNQALSFKITLKDFKS
jgi:FKBP-type peptidyl-prolyl cis-trans isomerase FklB